MHPRISRPRYSLRILLTAAVGMLALVNPASAAPDAAEVGDDAERHCVAYAQSDSSPFEAAEPRCWDKASEVEAFVAKVTGEQVRGSRAGGNNVIGRHYSGTSYSGSTLTIVGTTCSGGVWVASGWWNNRISSSSHYCGSSGTRFYDSSSCSGSSKSIFASASSLGWMNNRTSCVRYG